MTNAERWLEGSRDKRVVQVTREASGFVAVLVEKQSDGSGREACRGVAITMSDAVTAAGNKLPPA